MKRIEIDWDAIFHGCTVFALVAMFIFAVAWLSRGRAIGEPKQYTVESFTPDLTIRIQCSGECDLAAMIAEAREAAEK